MSKLLHNEIENLKKMVSGLSTIVEENVKFAVKAVIENNVEAANIAIKQDDAIDKMEIKVEEECLKILALFQPVAIDLRYIISILKINSDLERVGDLAVSIAQRILHIHTLKDMESSSFDFDKMSEASLLLLKKSIDALVTYDSNKATEVIQEDDEIDDMNKEMFSLFIQKVKENPEKAELYLQYLAVSRNLERIADHAVAIAEDVKYMAEGLIVRHQGDIEEG